MKSLWGRVAFFGALLLIAAAAALLPSVAPPRETPVWERTQAQGEYDAVLHVIVQGEGVGKPGVYNVPYGCTYGELFELAQAEESERYDADRPVSFSGAVLIGGEYYIYLVI